MRKLNVTTTLLLLVAFLPLLPLSAFAADAGPQFRRGRASRIEPPEKRPRAIAPACFDDEGNPIPCNPDGGSDPSTGSCQACEMNEYGGLECNNDAPHWSPCRPLWVCQSMPGQQPLCYADCGSRCLDG